MKIQERTGAGAGRSAAPAQPSVGDRLPTAPRERKPALAALAVLLILVGALGATMLVLQAGDRIEVVKVTKDIQAGESVTSDDVTSVMVAADGSIDYVQWSQLGALKTLKAKSTIYAGTVVVGQMFGAKSSLPAGKASVGVALKEGQYPSGIKSGDIVAVYRVGDNSSSSGSSGSSGSTGSSAGGNLIVDKARVNSRSDNSDAAVSTGNLSLTLLVDQSDAAAVAQAASAGSVAVVVVPGN
ncbi:SAF domain-containing protein [Streptomyces sp. NPDC000994]